MIPCWRHPDTNRCGPRGTPSLARTIESATFGPAMSTSKITLADVRRVAELARLALDDDEAARMQTQMDAILGYMAELDALDVADVPPTFHAVPIAAPLRADVLVR